MSDSSVNRDNDAALADLMRRFIADSGCYVDLREYNQIPADLVIDGFIEVSPEQAEVLKDEGLVVQPLPFAVED